MKVVIEYKLVAFKALIVFESVGTSCRTSLAAGKPVLPNKYLCFQTNILVNAALV